MTNQQPITKAVIAAAGFGTRFLPLTNAIPKEMLPLVDRPVIQHVVEELVGAGITDIIIVTTGNKKAIQEHFSPVNLALQENLIKAGKQEMLDKLGKVSKLAQFTFIEQTGPYGNAAPLISAEALLGDQPFIYAFADDFVMASPSRFQQLIATHSQYGGSVLTCVRKSEAHDYTRYGYVGGPAIDASTFDVATIIEKPQTAEKSPSDLASVSGYIFDPMIFRFLRIIEKQLKPGQEFSIQPAMQSMIDEGLHIYASEITNARYYDTGNKLEYVKAVIDFALMHEEIGEAFGAYWTLKQKQLKRPSDYQPGRTKIIRY